MTGNMYDWITAPNCNPLAGRCLHEGKYCYALADPKPNMVLKYSGPIRLDEKVLASKVQGGTRFLCSCNDLFAEGVPFNYILETIRWAKTQKGVQWAIQTKNPDRMLNFFQGPRKPARALLGTTIETNRLTAITDGCRNAPVPEKRVVRYLNYVTIEPIMDFDLAIMVDWLKWMQPQFVNIGADSGDNHLPEPSKEKTLALIAELRKFTEVRLKSNLARIIGKVA